jgi:tRNA threonylcarbamoyladenosine biosynthesis protein TsaE
VQLRLADETATRALGQRLAEALPAGMDGPFYVALEGPLGAGKTCLARAFLRALGYAGPVRSPTYTLLEPYEFEDRTVNHLDLYRLSDPAELEFLGVEDLFSAGHVLLVEWPERGLGLLPSADLTIRLAYAGQGREARLTAGSPAGEGVMGRLAPELSCGNH